jgi:hypothetical protein
VKDDRENGWSVIFQPLKKYFSAHGFDLESGVQLKCCFFFEHIVKIRSGRKVFFYSVRFCFQ